MNASKAKSRASSNERLCVSCRKLKARHDLIRITCDYRNRNVMLNNGAVDTGSGVLQGRSAYVCKTTACLEIALKTAKLKHALEGRKKKGQEAARRVSWPLEAQLIHSLFAECSDQEKTCQNTEVHRES
ncbi:MAG: YlxR family protein [Cyanobacteria bacterium SZAS LIN-2]|nr:YlxR family protein [Cyanobacteria bacterium SZAS LIN-2]MBS2011009.1 YlxR family protein [Cyanobacteria bacterium SZAS TMP-1]